MNQPNQHAPVFAPVTLAKGTTFIPTSYILHIKSKYCSGCGCVTNSSELYALNMLRSQFGMGKPVMNLVPVDRFYYNVPVVRKHLGQITVPACHECADFNLIHLPSPPEPDRVTINVMPGTKAQEAKAKAETKPKAATLEDLA